MLGALLALILAGIALGLPPLSPPPASAAPSDVILTLTQSSTNSAIGTEVTLTATLTDPNGPLPELPGGWFIEFSGTRSDGWSSGPIKAVNGVATYPTPAPLVEAPPPTATPLPTFAPEVAQAQPTPAPRPTRQAGAIPTFPPVGSRGSNPVGTSDSIDGAFFPVPPGTMPTVVVRQPNVPGAGPGDVAQSMPNRSPVEEDGEIVLPGITRGGQNGGLWPDGVPTPSAGKKPNTAAPTPRPTATNRPGQQVGPGDNRPSFPAIRGKDDNKKNNDKKANDRSKKGK